MTAPIDAHIDVDVLRAHTSDFAHFQCLQEMLTDDESARASGYRFKEPRNTFILARGLVRRELSLRLGVKPRDVSFDVRPSGKPDVRRVDASRPDWRFNVSHTGPHVAVAFALGADVGIDIERPDRATDALKIAGRYFTGQELKALEQTPQNRQRSAFLAGWTRKEAIVKARGLTMAECLATLSVSLDPTARYPTYEDAPGFSKRAPCRLTALEFADPSLIAAVAVIGHREPRLNIRVVSGETFD